MPCPFTTPIYHWTAYPCERLVPGAPVRIDAKITA